MKKLSILLAMVMLLCSVQLPASAQIGKAESQGLFIETPSIPSEVIEYAKVDFPGHLMAMIESNDFVGDIYKVRLGTPFTYLNDGTSINQYYFPVLYNGVIEYIYRVYEDQIYFKKQGV